MDDTRPVRIGQGPCQVNRDRRRPLGRYRLLTGELPQIAPASVLHDEERSILLGIDFVNANDAGMREPGEFFTFTQQEILRLGAGALRAPLDGDVALEAAIDGPEDIGLTAAAELADDHVLAAERRRMLLDRAWRARFNRGARRSDLPIQGS